MSEKQMATQSQQERGDNGAKKVNETSEVYSVKQKSQDTKD